MATTMQQWKEPDISTVWLANGKQVLTEVNGISPVDGSGFVLVQGRDIKVMPLEGPWSFAWSEVIAITRNDGSALETTLKPFQIGHTTAMVDRDNETVYILLDAGVWREMTEQEQEYERRTWAADMTDMAHVEREWRNYRNAGLGNAG